MDLVLLGAGASVEAGVPMVFEMTDAIRRRLNEADLTGGGSLGRVLDYVCERLGSHGPAEGPRPSSLDVERVFSAVELLAERERLEISPFVEGWSPGVARWEQGAGRTRHGNVYTALRDRMLVELRGLMPPRESGSLTWSPLPGLLPIQPEPRSPH